MPSSRTERSTCWSATLTATGGTRLGWSLDFDQPAPTWQWAPWTLADVGWASFAQASPDGYQYIYMRDGPTAYGPVDRVDLARVPRGLLADLAAWEVFAGIPQAPSWVRLRRAARWMSENSWSPSTSCSLLLTLLVYSRGTRVGAREWVFPVFTGA